MISDERQRRVFALWISLPLETFATWLDQQEDKEELRRLIAHMEQIDNRYDFPIHR